MVLIVAIFGASAPIHLQAAESSSIVTPPVASRDLFVRFAGSPHATTALREFVRSLDPEADLLAPGEAAIANAPVPDGVCDLGVSLTVSNDYPTVISARDGSPAQSAGLLHGDQIIAVDGQSTNHMRLFEVNTRLRGPLSSKVTLRVLDVAGNEHDIVVERAAQRPQPTTRLSLSVQGVAYHRLGGFSPTAVQRLRAEAKRAQAERARTLILDVRNNAGGALDAAMAAARVLLPVKNRIAFLEYSKPESSVTFFGGGTDKITIPLLVLVNGGTAVEAEVFAAALRDNQRARLVGSRTFGRGHMYGQFSLPDGSVLSIPTARYLPPSRRPFHGVGLTPDVVVELPRETERPIAAVLGASDWKEDKKDAVLARAMDLAAR